MGSHEVFFPIKLVRIENKVEFSTSVYPNPSNGNITIETHGDSYEEVQLQVFDFSGKQVTYKRFGRQNTEVFKTTADLSRFSKGVYQVHLLINKKKYIYKVVLY